MASCLATWLLWYPSPLGRAAPPVKGLGMNSIGLGSRLVELTTGTGAHEPLNGSTLPADYPPMNDAAVQVAENGSIFDVASRIVTNKETMQFLNGDVLDISDLPVQIASEE